MIQKLQKIRKMRGMTQAQLAKVSGVPRVCISRYESGKYQPGMKNLLKLASALDLSVDELLKKAS